MKLSLTKNPQGFEPQTKISLSSYIYKRGFFTAPFDVYWLVFAEKPYFSMLLPVPNGYAAGDPAGSLLPDCRSFVTGLLLHSVVVMIIINAENVE